MTPKLWANGQLVLWAWSSGLGAAQAGDGSSAVVSVDGTYSPEVEEISKGREQIKGEEAPRLRPGPPE